MKTKLFVAVLFAFTFTNTTTGTWSCSSQTSTNTLAGVFLKGSANDNISLVITDNGGGSSQTYNFSGVACP